MAIIRSVEGEENQGLDYQALFKQPNYYTIPNPSSVETVKRYVEHGIKPGKFLTALFSYHLSALKYADSINKPLLEAWVDWMHWEMPGTTTGSKEIVEQHIKNGGMRGKNE
mgnify:CR=1 FL=1